MRTDPAACPNCAKVLDGATGVDNLARPGPGDVSICIYCAQLNVFTDDLALRPATKDEAREMLQNPTVRKAIAAVMQVKRGRR